MGCGISPHDRHRTTERMEGFGWACGLWWRGAGLQRERAFRSTRLTVGASNDLQMERNLTGGLSVVYQGHSASLGPFRERFSPAHETRYERGDGCVWECGWAQNGQRRELGEPEQMQVLKNMQMKCK